MTQTYEAWRITYQSSEQAARAAFERMMQLEQGKCLHQIAEPAPTESVLIDGTAYVVHAEVAAELLRLHIELQTAPQAVQPAVPVLFVSREQLESHTDHLASEAGRYLPARKTAVGKFTMPLYARPAEGVPAPVVTGGTPGLWSVRKRTNDAGELLDCFVTAPDCQGRAYDADILGDDYDSPALKLADAELIVAAVNAYRALAATQPAAQGLKPCKPIQPEGMTGINARLSFNFGWLACERHHGIRPADVAEALALVAAQAKQGG